MQRSASSPIHVRTSSEEAMKKTSLLATVLLLGASASAIGAATNNQLQGSDTLKDMTKLIVTSCAASAGLDYIGGSSGAGENAMAMILRYSSAPPISCLRA